jgi:1-acyl-sn-glycerol-3-phosphate acyltransferase
VEEWHYKPAQDLGIGEMERLRSVKRESGLLGFLARKTWWFWVRAVLRLTERIQINGTEHLPATPPFIVVANHASHLDALVLATALPRRLRDAAFPLAAGDTFFETPPMAAFATGMMNALPMWRKNCGRHVLDALRQRLVSEPCGYILFPEGTRSRTGQMSPFRPGIGMLVAGTAVPVIPCHLSGTFDALPPHARWPRSGNIVLDIGGPCTFQDVPNEKDGWRTVADKLEQEVRALAEARLAAEAGKHGASGSRDPG